jgi:hypothetical protein
MIEPLEQTPVDSGVLPDNHLRQWRRESVPFCMESCREKRPSREGPVRSLASRPRQGSLATQSTTAKDLGIRNSG